MIFSFALPPKVATQVSPTLFNSPKRHDNLPNLMNKTQRLLTSAALLGLSASAQAQGLLNLNSNDSELDKKIPFHWTVGMNVGWDSNPRSSQGDSSGSAFMSGHLGAEYATGDRRTSYIWNGSYSPIYYFEEGELYHNARLSFSVRHKVNPRLTINDSAYVSYEIEPDYQIGASIARRTEQYLYFYNGISASYAWNRRFSTVFSHNISGVYYDDSASSGEDNLTNTFGVEGRYALSRTTTAALTYRFAIAQYDNGFGDFTSQYFLAGLDHKFSPRLTGSFRVGAEIQDRDNGGDHTAPYFEGNLSYAVAKKTQLGWYHRLGYENSDIGGYGERYSYRTGLSLSQRVNSRLTANVGAHYIHDTFEEGGALDSFDDDTIALSTGLAYNVYRNVTLNGSYSYTTVSSGNPFREFDRHMLSLGVSARF